MGLGSEMQGAAAMGGPHSKAKDIYPGGTD